MANTKILLIAPKAPMGDQFQPSLGLCYLKSYIENKKGITVDILDLNLISMSRLLDIVHKTKPIIAGITTFSPNRFSSLDIAREIKKVSPGSILVLGGFHASFLYEQILNNYPFVDVVIRGEGEETLLEMVNIVEENGDFCNVKGLALKKNNDVIVNEARQNIEDIDELPFPYYMDYSMPYNGRSFKAASIVTARGCFGVCKFCAAPAFWKKNRFRSPENVVAEISKVVKRYGVKYINFMDDTFTDSAQRVNSICDLINKLNANLMWRATARINTLDYRLLKQMKDCGCVELSIGIESGSQRILDTLGKKTTVEKIKEVCEIIKKLGINLSACFIVGSPGENRMSIEETKRIIEYIRPDSFNVSQALYLYSGTAFSKEYSKNGIYNDNLWLDRNISNIKYLAEHDASELVKWQMEIIKTAWKTQPFVNKIRYIWGIIKWIKFSQISNVIFSLLRKPKR